MSLWKVPLSDITFDQEESLAVQRVLEKKWLTQGEEVQAFVPDIHPIYNMARWIVAAQCRRLP